jgi:hypothetical protein
MAWCDMAQVAAAMAQVCSQFLVICMPNLQRGHTVGPNTMHITACCTTAVTATLYLNLLSQHSVCAELVLFVATLRWCKPCKHSVC